MGAVRGPTSMTGHSIAVLPEKLAANQHATDVGSPRADLVKLGVAPQARDRKFIDVTITAQRLERFTRHPCRLLGRIQDRAGGILARGLATIAGARDRIQIRAADLEETGQATGRERGGTHGKDSGGVVKVTN